MDFIILPKFIQQLNYIGYDINIMAIVVVFIKLQYILLRDNNLIDIDFTNANKFI